MEQHNQLAKIEQMSIKQRDIFEVTDLPEVAIAIISGAIRIGKSFWGVGSLIKWMLKEVVAGRYGNYALLAYNTTLVNTNLIPYASFWLWYFGINFETKDKHIVVDMEKTAFDIYGFGASNASSYASFQGATLKGIFIDEGAILNKHALEVARDRVLTYSVHGHSKIIITSNPEGGKQHWFYKEWIEKYHTIHCSLLDSPIFSQRELDEYKRIYSKANYKRRILGEWVVSAGAVYEHDFKTCDISEVPKLYEVKIGVDEGRGDAFTGVATGLSDYDNNFTTLYVLDQYYETESKLITNVLNIKEFAKSLNEIWGEHATTTIIGETNPGVTYDTLCDDDELYELGIDVNKVQKKIKTLEYKGRSAIQERIDITNGLAALERIVFVTVNGEVKAKELYGAFANAEYKNGVRRDDGTSDIDSLDGFEYSISEDLSDLNEEIKEHIGGFNEE